MAEAAPRPSPGVAGAWAWALVGVYLLALLGWELVKVVRAARRERAVTEEFRQRKRQLIEEVGRRDDD